MMRCSRVASGTARGVRSKSVRLRRTSVAAGGHPRIVRQHEDPGRSFAVGPLAQSPVGRNLAAEMYLNDREHGACVRAAVVAQRHVEVFRKRPNDVESPAALAERI